MPDYLKGFATFPGSVPDDLDGVVMQYQFFGTEGTALSFGSYTLGKSCVHEVGHWLNILHPWGNGYDCAGNDGISDTPSQEVYHFSCVTDITECSNTLMLENYMQYTHDPCQSVFTDGQKTVMRANFLSGGSRESILELKGCQETEEIRGGSLSGTVWEDLNDDGSISNIESGVQNIEVMLFNCSDILVDFTNTDANGEYEFNDLSADNYYITIRENSLPNNIGPNPIWYQKNNCFQINDGEMETQDIPLLELVTIDSRVWEDMDGNGVYENSEPGLTNVTVNVHDINGQVMYSDNTNSFGLYYIDRIFPQSYYLSFQVNGIYENTVEYQGTNTLIDSDVTGEFGNNTTKLLNFQQGEYIEDLFAGYYRMSHVGRYIWHDLNANGIQESGEPGLNGFELSILKFQNGFWVLVDDQYTNNNGEFDFEVAPGTYRLSISDMPNSFVSTMNDMGNNETLDSDFNQTDLNTSDFELTSGSEKMDLAGGFFKGGGMRGIVWFDENENGIIDPTENPAPGIMVQAYNDATLMMDQQFTDNNGEYHFDGLYPDDYYLQLLIPANTIIVPQPSMNNYFHQSNGPGTTPYFDVSSDETINNIMAGLSVGPLAIQQVNFTGTMIDDHIQLNWSVLADESVENVQIEKLNGEEWEIIHSSDYRLNDIYIDQEVNWNNFNHYRLLATESTGHQMYSKTIAIFADANSDFNIQIINPIHSNLDISIRTDQNELTNLFLYDFQGKLISSIQNHSLNIGDNNISIETKNISNGMYLLDVVRKNIHHTFKVAKL